LELPRWTCWLPVLLVVAAAGFAVTAVPPSGRWIVAVLLAAAVAPWVVEAAGIHLPDGVRVLGTLVPLGVAYLGAYPFGYAVVHGGTDQVMLMIGVWLTGEMLASASPGWAAATVVLTLGIAVGRQASDPTYGSAMIWVVGIAVAATIGVILRSLLLNVACLRAAQAELGRQAAVAERQRIAREVHDVIAHSLSVTMLHVTGARLSVQRGDDRAATEALEEAERSGRASLNEVRHIVGLLRAGGNGTEAPQPGTADIAGLIQDYQAGGLEVRCQVDPSVIEVEDSVGLAVYRVVEESLANVVKHAPGGIAEVDIRLRRGNLRVLVRNQGGTPATSRADGGVGLLGMRERVESLGGTFWSGPSDGGWEVRCSLPVTSPERRFEAPVAGA
jgi:signal transduction histidine kinase